MRFSRAMRYLAGDRGSMRRIPPLDSPGEISTVGKLTFSIFTEKRWRVSASAGVPVEKLWIWILIQQAISSSATRNLKLNGHPSLRQTTGLNSWVTARPFLAAGKAVYQLTPYCSSHPLPFQAAAKALRGRSLPPRFLRLQKHSRCFPSRCCRVSRPCPGRRRCLYVDLSPLSWLPRFVVPRTERSLRLDCSKGCRRKKESQA